MKKLKTFKENSQMDEMPYGGRKLSDEELDSVLKKYGKTSKDIKDEYAKASDDNYDDEEDILYNELDLIIKNYEHIDHDIICKVLEDLYGYYKYN